MREEEINVLGLFDGISCGQVALERAGIEVGKYYSSEIDKYAIQVTEENYPNTVQLGDITKWKKWKIDWASIDLIMAGFPCQAWSVAGKMKGDKDPRGALVHDLIKVWKKVKKHNPKVKFLFENVKMKTEFIEYISELFGVEPIEINSSLVSAQNRRRLYWTNIKGIEQPKDENILFKDVVAWSRSTRYPKNKEKYVEERSRFDGKANTLTTGSGCALFSSKNYVLAACRGRKPRIVEKLFDGKSSCLTASYFKGLDADNRPGLIHRKSLGKNYQDARKNGFRMLTPNECEFLQTLPNNYTSSISNSQRYKAIGNGWTVDVIAHILKNMKKKIRKKKLIKRY